MSRQGRKKRRPSNPDLPTIAEKKELVDKAKALGCRKCDEKRPWIIDLHHVNPKTKKFGISRGVRDQVTLSTFIAEIKKCIPLCRNHHGDFHRLEAYDKITLEEYLNDGTE